MNRSRLLLGFLINAALLGAVIAALWTFNFVVDPYRANLVFNLGVDREPITARLSYYDWLVADYRNRPAPVVVIGDSRMDALEEQALSAAAGRSVINLGAGGARWRDSLAMSRYVMRTAAPEQLVLQLNVDQMNGSARMDRMTEAADLLEAPLRYYLHPRISGASARVTWSMVAGGGQVDEAPPMHIDAFWEHQLDQVRQVTYANWSWPEQALKELEELRDLCREHGTELTVVMLPVHDDVRALQHELGVDVQDAKVRAEIRRLVDVVDFDRASRITADRSLYLDPFHMRDPPREMIEEMFGVDHGLASRSQPPE